MRSGYGQRTLVKKKFCRRDTAKRKPKKKTHKQQKKNTQTTKQTHRTDPKKKDGLQELHLWTFWGDQKGERERRNFESDHLGQCRKGGSAQELLWKRKPHPRRCFLIFVFSKKKNLFSRKSRLFSAIVAMRSVAPLAPIWECLLLSLEKRFNWLELCWNRTFEKA